MWRVPKVPRRHVRAVHLPVVLLGVADEHCVLLGVEELVLRKGAVGGQEPSASPLEVGELSDHLVFARQRQVERDRLTVPGTDVPHVIEAAVPSPGRVGSFGIDDVEIGDHRLHRCAQAVEVETVEAGLRPSVAEGVVSRSQPLDEPAHVTVAPHPRREPLEVGECRRCIDVGGLAHHVAVDSIGVGPVGLDGDRVEALLVDQTLRDARSFAIEIVRAVVASPSSTSLRSPTESSNAS